MLLQFRGSQVGIYPNRWDQAAGGHVDEGQTYDQTAVNELAEELGIENVELTTLGTFRSNETLDNHQINNQFERSYLVRVPHDIKLKPEPAEISELRWFTPHELAAEIAQHPENFTPGFLYALRKYLPEFLKV
jgi:isopentenyl-diphosphate delta-isomerase